ncbi:MAG: exonuclease [Nitrososphaerota archaeon]|nr:exonuclease [Nitrososphaerota archaeon]
MSGRAKISLYNGIVVEYGESTYALDPKGPSKSHYTFVSHAHMDHVQNPDPNSRVLASRETKMLAKARGFDLGRTTESADGVKLLDSGHILGARAISIGDEVFYTGDAAGRDRAFMGKCRTRKARVLITETTFGKSNYVFPPIEQVEKEVNSKIGMMFDKGRPVVLMGYALGKSQVLSHLFSSWSPLYFHEQVAKMNDVYVQCGVSLKSGKKVSADLSDLPRGPWVMVSPMMSSRNKLAQRLKKEYRAAFIAFSGWAADPGYAYSLGADFAFAVSDHCDYKELTTLVHDVSPEVVYTTHGFTQEFAADLRSQGFDAKPLAGYQTFLSEY